MSGPSSSPPPASLPTWEERLDATWQATWQPENPSSVSGVLAQALERQDGPGLRQALDHGATLHEVIENLWVRGTPGFHLRP